MKSLSELQQSPDVGLPQRTVKVCVAARLVDELEETKHAFIEAQVRLDEVRAEIDKVREKTARDEASGPPRRIGSASPTAALEEEAARLEAESDALAEKGDAIRERMEENTVVLLLRGKSQGEWREWARRHPARDEDEDRQGFERDKRWAFGTCNIDAVEADLRLFVAKYNGEDASDAWAELIATRGVPANITKAAATVVAMHEGDVDAGKSLRDWLDSRRSARGSE